MELLNIWKQNTTHDTDLQFNEKFLDVKQNFHTWLGAFLHDIELTGIMYST